MSVSDLEYEKATIAARNFRIHISPLRDDREAVEFLAAVYDTAEEVRGLESIYYDLGELAQRDIPANDYKCGMIFAQLGLWYDQMQTTLDELYIDGIRFILYTTALDVIRDLVDQDMFGEMI